MIPPNQFTVTNAKNQSYLQCPKQCKHKVMTTVLEGAVQSWSFHLISHNQVIFCSWAFLAVTFSLLWELKDHFSSYLITWLSGTYPGTQGSNDEGGCMVFPCNAILKSALEMLPPRTLHSKQPLWLGSHFHGTINRAQDCFGVQRSLQEEKDCLATDGFRFWQIQNGCQGPCRLAAGCILGGGKGWILLIQSTENGSNKFWINKVWLIWYFY